MKRIIAAVALALLSISVLSVVTTVRADETLLWAGNILSNGDPVSTPFLLQTGMLYRIVVSEKFEHNLQRNLGADAQYYTTSVQYPYSGWQWGNFFPARDGHSFVQINGMDVHWGPFSNGDTSHTYSVYYIGKGEQITFTIVDWVDGNYDNNGCHLPVRIYELPPCAGSPRTIGFWKNHPDRWPVDSIVVGGVAYTKDLALEILRSANAKDATSMLVAQLIAARLNVLSGTWCGASSTVFDSYAMNDADTFLAAHPLGSNPRGAERTYALMLKDILDGFNNGR
jgi:hypothetical protein